MAREVTADRGGRIDRGPTGLCRVAELRDRWHKHVRGGRSHEAFEEFVDFYNAPGSFARWSADRREAFFDDHALEETSGTSSSMRR